MGLASLPLLALLTAILFMKSRQNSKGWRWAILRGGVVWGAYAVLSTEALSLMEAIHTWSIVLVWSFPIFLFSIWILRRPSLGKLIHRPSFSIETDWVLVALISCIALIFVLTLIVALRAPPQTWDSLNYRLSRVTHWVQNRSLKHYVTGIEVQNSMPPGAELLLLPFFLLSKGDHLANLIQWIAMVGSVFGVSWIAAQLGANKLGQVLSAVIAATIPMGIVQSSSTMTDYVVAFWMVCVASESVSLLDEDIAWDSIFFLSFSAGLAILTKPTAVVYLLPFAILVAITMMKKAHFRKWLPYAGIAILIVLIINAGHWLRNQSTFGSPFGKSSRVAEHANGNLTPRGVTSNLLRNASLHLGSPWPKVNHEIYRVVVGIHFKLGADPNDSRSTYSGDFRILPLNATDEYTGNPIHVVSFLVVFGWLIFFGRRQRRLFIIGLVAASTFLVYSLAFQWIIFGSRYQLPFFILFSAVAGTFLSQRLPKTSLGIVGVAYMVFSLPWLIGIETRPIIPIFASSKAESIFIEDREDLYLYGYRKDFVAYKDVAERIISASCQSVGLQISGGGPEYIWWELMDAPFSSIRIDWIARGTASDKYAKSDFLPCAVICDGTCPQDWTSVRGLPLDMSVRDIRLFMDG